MVDNEKSYHYNLIFQDTYIRWDWDEYKVKKLLFYLNLSTNIEKGIYYCDFVYIIQGPYQDGHLALVLWYVEKIINTLK